MDLKAKRRRLGRCPTCGGKLAKGEALENTSVASPDFIGDTFSTCTMSQTGPPVMRQVLKCEKCGYSRRHHSGDSTEKVGEAEPIRTMESE